MTSISIAMTAYNAARYIDEQLQSFAMQTRLPDELVITDDGSKDETPAIVERFAARVPFPVRYVRNETNLGMHLNFERCVSLATGDLVFMSDDDDAWFPDKLAVVEAAFDADPSILSVVNDQTIADADGRLTDRTVLQNVRKLGYGDEHYGTGACTAMRRSLVQLLLPFPRHTVPYDHWTNHLPFILGVRHLIETPLQFYRRHANNMTASLLANDKASLLKMATADTGDMRPAYADKIVGLDFETERLRERAGDLEALGLENARQRALDALAAERKDHEARIHALNRGRAVRPFVVAKHLAAGNYASFQGWKSAAKDLLA